MKNPIHPRSRKGFTLVELLVVIAIIAALAAISIPGVNAIMRNARVTEGQKMAKDLVFSIESFEKDYDYLPYPANESAPDSDTKYVLNLGGDLLNVLVGGEDEVNTKSTAYFNVRQTDKKTNGLEYSGDKPVALWDPFGSPFEVLIDYDYDKELSPMEIHQKISRDRNGANLTIRGESAIAASPGANEDWNYSDWNENHAITTW
ncbi:hypothetical protein Rhal01_00770 [Rubritalea halochordaticola]|uniref:Prepilin-type N-terminal cleavage/methylation domain-containing protein n=1 Tax=Rubritalea halochordaticola TaxID=714537 RepID=A0ABP9UW63_9BACT